MPMQASFGTPRHENAEQNATSSQRNSGLTMSLKAAAQRRGTFGSVLKRMSLNRRGDLKSEDKVSSSSKSYMMKSQQKLDLEEYKNKMRYRDFLIELVERKVKIKRAGQREKKVDRIRYDHADEPFEIKKQFIEKRIEDISGYFTNESNLSNPSREIKSIIKNLTRI